MDEGDFEDFVLMETEAFNRTVRERAAIAAMNGILAASFDHQSPADVAARAVSHADALIAELEKTNPPLGDPED